jgi:hypothetical protein
MCRRVEVVVTGKILLRQPISASVWTGTYVGWFTATQTTVASTVSRPGPPWATGIIDATKVKR